jgi:formimidoylglutamate deiminase
MTSLEPGWLPDLLYRDGKFESGIAMFADETGFITRFSQNPEELAKAQKMSGKAILPGLVNAHSHAFQRALRGRTEHRSGAGRDNFWTWREAMYHAANRLSPEDIYAVARMAFLEMLLSGITTVGEFHYLHHAPDGTRYEDRNLLAKQVLRAAEETGVRIALLRTAYARAGWREDPHPGQRRFITPEPEQFIADTEDLRAYVRHACAPGHSRVGVAPHSIRAVPLYYLIRVAEYARANKMPVHMHVAEQPAEVEACLGEHRLRPLDLLHQYGILDQRFTAVHGIHINDREVARLAAAGGRVCACPTTERNLGDGAVPADRLQREGVPICFGSDSNMQIDLLEDARELEYHLRMSKLERAVLTDDCEPGSLAERLFAGATAIGTQSLGTNVGALEIGRPADFFTVDLHDPYLAGADQGSLLSHILFCAGRGVIRDTFVAGHALVRNGQHVAASKIIERFAAVQRQLWAT